MFTGEFLTFLLGVAVSAFIAGFGVGWFAPAKSWPLYVFAGVCVIAPLVLVVIWALLQESGENRNIALGAGFGILAPGVGFISVIPAMLGGGSAQWFRKRKESGNQKP